MLLRVCVVCISLVCAPGVLAQDPFSGGNDPFGTDGDDPFNMSGGDPFTGDAGAGANQQGGAFGEFGQPDASAIGGAAASAEPTEEDPDPVVRFLRESPPKNAAEMAQALTWMTRIKRWDEAGRLLDRVQNENWSLETRARLAREAGPTVWLRLKSDASEINDSQRALVRDILTAPATLARTPEWIDQWIDKLGSASAGERRLAQLRLQDGSMNSVRRLVQRLLDGDPKVQPVMLAGTTVQFGDLGVAALKTACLIQDAPRAARVFLALAQLPGQDFTAELAAGLSSAVLEPVDQAELAQRLAEKYGSLPSAQAVHDYLKKRFDDQLAVYQVTRTQQSSLPNILWRLSPDRQSIQLAEALRSNQELERLAQLAALRLQLKALTTEDRIDCGAALLQRAYQVSPARAAGKLQAQMMTDLPVFSVAGEQLSLVEQGQYLQQVFEQAGQWQMHGGALRALQLMSDANRVEAPLSFLSGLLRDSRPLVRFTALEVVAGMDPEQDFLGAETAIETALEMSRLASGPHSLVIGLQSELRQVAQQQLQSLTGADVTSVNSARAALLVLNGERPVEQVVIVDRLADQSLFELLQRIRNTKKGHSLPIAVLTDALYAHERQAIVNMPGVFQSILSRQETQMQRVLDRLESSLDTQPMTGDDRAHFVDVGTKFLARVVGDRERYAFYPLGAWRESLVSTSSGLPAAAQSRLLSGVGSIDSQRRLIRLAAAASANMEGQFAAANAFGASVRRFGLQLASDDVRASYDLYNRLGPEDPQVARALGYILDVIEAQAEQIPWPDDL